MNNMNRVPERVRKALKYDYVQLMERHEYALVQAYPVGLKFVKMYVDMTNMGAVYVITASQFSSADYDNLTWQSVSAFYSFTLSYKKLDKRGRPNGREQVLSHQQFDAGCTVVNDNQK